MAARPGHAGDIPSAADAAIARAIAAAARTICGEFRVRIGRGHAARFDTLALA